MTILFSSYINNNRSKDIIYCIKKNLENEFIDKVVLFYEDTLNLEHNKLEKISFHRPTYTDFFTYAKRYYADFSIISNSDIYFDESISLIKNMESNDCYALTRYELDGNLYQVPEHSQDVWIFKEMVKDIFGEFYLGIGGCDNRIAYEIEKSGYNISNPCLSIKVHHVHTDTNREWLNLKRIDPPYLMVKECRVK